jgi:archaeoflavoprotein AfpA
MQPRLMGNKGRFAWGISGSGDDIRLIFDTMRSIASDYPEVDIRVYISKAAEQVLTWYRLMNDVKDAFKAQVESTPNTPFLAGELQSGKYDFLVVAPATSNTVAKIALGLGDTMLTNAVSMAAKAGVPVYVLPCEAGEGETETTLPSGRVLRLRIREVDSKYIRMLGESGEIRVLHEPADIRGVVDGWYRQVS